MPRITKKSKKTVLVTGAAGFIGSHVVHALLARGYSVVCVDNLNEYYDLKLKKDRLAQFKKDVTFYRADIAKRAALEKVFKEHRIDAICHLAAQAGVRYSIEHPAVYGETNIIGTMNVFELAKKYHVPHVVFGSSSSVYGLDKIPFREDAHADTPISTYAASKRSGELIAHVYNHLFGITVSCLRFFTVYGPYGRPDMAPHTFVSAVLKGEPLTVYNNGTMKRDFTYVADVVSGIILALEKPLGFQILNIGNGTPVTLMRFIRAIERAVGKRATLKFLPLQAGDVVDTHADIGRARKLLGYRSTTDIEEGMAQFVKWYKDYYGEC